MAHFRANVNRSSCECFKHFDNEEKMFAWISERTGEKITSYEECEKWTRKQLFDHYYIEVLEVDNLRVFYNERRKYVECLNQIDTLAFKAKHASTHKRRVSAVNRFCLVYDKANDIAKLNPEVWQGEI